MDCLPAYTGAAIFTSLVLLDLIHKKWSSLPGHILFGIFTVLLLIYICQSKGAMLAWILLSIPLIFILLGILLSAIKSKPQATSPTLVKEKACTCSYNPCKCRRPCVKPSPPPPGPCIKPTLQS